MPRSRRPFAGPFAACILAGAALGFARPMHSLAPLTWGTRAAPAPHPLYRWKGDVAFGTGDLLIFVRGGQVALYADYRGEGRFEGLRRPVARLARDQAVFRVRGLVMRPASSP